MMRQLLRLTFGNKDHKFRILNEGAVSRETKLIDLELDGQLLRIVKADRSWVREKHVEGVSDELIEAVARNITLRFRI